ncbi:MAG TPA: patatin-like protein [Pyrinomonadaceae bacterium]|nr:patatin-like protein [Pyrinomonadaceae bacterium]
MPSTNVNAVPAPGTPQPATPAAEQQQPPPPVAFTQELRFAVVMYGGLSLAIYMNGVSQEMLRMVRATAPGRKDPRRAFRSDAQLSSTEKVYRQLGQILERGVSDIPNPEKVAPDAPIRTRFLVDILSGSSAGGINSIFLAKALANDEPMDELKSLWVTEGDIGVLLNDPQSVKGVALTLQKPPRSLLNSERMYLKLLDALDGMARKRDGRAGAAQPEHDAAADPSPNVEELDLFVTATDMEGQIVKLKLADRHVSELRHRSVFHFVYSERDRDPDCECARGQADPCYCFRNDFRADNNPFLAYAARCTSAHTAAFEPMSLGSIDAVLRRHPSYSGKHDLRASRANWQRFYEEYLSPRHGKKQQDGAEKGDGGEHDRRKEAAKSFAGRFFNDGGTLDNYPFSHTINTLPYHQASLPVDRKLFYVEPAPRHPEDKPPLEREPHIFENAWMSLSTLPRYESIREDLQRVLERNHLLERVQRILKGLEHDVSVGVRPENPPLNSTQFSERTVGEMIKDEGMGPGWGGCQRLRVAETTDELALMLTRAAGFDAESDEFRALRYDLVTEWRNQRYDPYGLNGRKSPPPDFMKASDQEKVRDKFSENLFLFRYDLKWRLRRLRFVMDKLDEISLFDENADKVIKNADERLLVGGEEVALSKLVEEDPKLKKRLRHKLSKIKRGLGSAQEELLRARRWLLERGKDNALRGRIEKLGPETLGMKAGELLGGLEKLVERSQQGKKYKGKPTLEELTHALDKILDDLNENVLRDVLDKASNRVKGVRAEDGKTVAFGILDEGVLRLKRNAARPRPASLVIRSALLHYYLYFDRYDMISYPILYSTNVGEETDPVEVFRISPEDATNANSPGTDQKSKPKLAGTKLASFGAFFKEAFRTNDIMMGRLDGAERIITAALPDPSHAAQRKYLIEKAQRIIIEEEVGLADTARVAELLEKLPASVGSTDEQKKQFLALTGELKDKRVQFALAAHLNEKDQLEHFRKAYEVDRELEAQSFVRTLARGTKVLGLMLENVAEVQRLDKKRIRWVTRLAQVFYGMVEVAVPDSVPHLIFRHWLKLLYLFELLTVVAGIIFTNPALNQFGLIAFGITVTAQAAVLVLGDAMRGRHPWMIVLRVLVVPVVAVLTALGAFSVYAAVFGGDDVWNVFSDVRKWVGPGRLSGWKKGLLLAAIASFFLVSIRKDLSAAWQSLKDRWSSSPEP